MNKSINSDDVKEFYNDTFFNEEGVAVKAQISITVRTADKAVIIPGIEAHPGTTIEGIFREFHGYLEKNGPLGELGVEKGTNPNEDQVKDFQQVDYRGNSYLIEERQSGAFVVRRTTDNEILSPKSPTVKAIIKAYQDSKKQ